MAKQVSLVVHGAAGRMGRRVVALSMTDAGVAVVGGVEHAGHGLLGQDLGDIAGCGKSGVLLSSSWPAANVVIDFSLPAAVDACIDHCVTFQTALVVATTGLSESQHAKLRQAGESIPVVWSPSMSLAVNLCMKLSQQITRALDEVPGGVDIEIIERHHRYKADAPSGTALKFGDLIAEALGGSTQHVHGRQGHTGERTREEIGYHAVRAGDNPGEHTILFGMLGEKIELNVAASNRDCYAAGAIAAAKWLARPDEHGRPRPAGVYSMFDVLGF